MDKKMNFEFKEKYELADAIEIVHILRDPEHGCPWDKEQTHESIRKNFIEETYEACDAIDQGDTALLREELGDVLLQVALHTEMERERGSFDINDVADELCKKLILRHPHIFGDVKADTSSKVLENWDKIKRGEKGRDTAAKSIDDVPAALPALAKSQKVQKRAADFGFDYPDIASAISDLRSEVDELEAAIRGEGDVREEAGDLIFAAVNVARLSGQDAEEVAEAACKKFVMRFKSVETAAHEQNVDMKSCGIDKLNQLWSSAKIKIRKE